MTESEHVKPEVVQSSLPPLNVSVGQTQWVDGSTITVLVMATLYGQFEFKLTGDMARQIGEALTKVGSAASSGLILAGAA